MLVLHLLLVLDRLSRPAVREVVSPLVARSTKLFSSGDHHLADDVKPGFVSRESEHDEVRISSVDAVGLVGVVGQRSPFLPDELHDLVLALARATGVREDYRQVLPVPVAPYSFLHVVPDCLSHVAQEGSARGYQVRVERGFVDVGFDFARINVFLFELLQQVLLLFLHLEALHGGPEAARPLLVHLGARGHSVNSQVEQLPGPHDVDDLVHVFVDVLALFLKVFGLPDGLAFGVAAGVDESVHVHVEVVDVWVGGVDILLAALQSVSQDFGVAHAQPLEEHRHSHN